MSLSLQLLSGVLAILLFAVYNVCSMDDNSTESPPVNILGHTHDHREDIHFYRKAAKRPISSIDNRNYTMLITGGFRPKNKTSSLTKHIVSIRTSRPTAYFGDNHFCVGVIISEQLVLTAAHCVVDRRRIVTRAHRLVVVAGTPNRLKKTAFTVERKVAEVLPHSNYMRKRLHDIAILRLDKRLPDNNEYVKVLPLTSELPEAGSTCDMVGWGQLFYRGPYTAVAIQAKLTVISSAECRDFYPDVYHESMICAGRQTEWDVDACRGDSGGPLICGDSVAAVVSWSSHCGEKGKPTVFTSVYHHRDWIQLASDGKKFHGVSFNRLLLFNLILYICSLN